MRVVDAARVVLVEQCEEEGPGRRVDAAPHVSLLRASRRLALRGDDALLHAFGERGLEAGEALGHERHPLRDRLPVRFGVARHEVERHAHVLHRAPEHAQVAQSLAGVVLLERELESLAHHVGGEAVGVADHGVASSARRVARSCSARASIPSGE